MIYYSQCAHVLIHDRTPISSCIWSDMKMIAVFNSTRSKYHHYPWIKKNNREIEFHFTEAVSGNCVDATPTPSPEEDSHGTHGTHGTHGVPLYRVRSKIWDQIIAAFDLVTRQYSTSYATYATKISSLESVRNRSVLDFPTSNKFDVGNVATSSQKLGC